MGQTDPANVLSTVAAVTCIPLRVLLVDDSQVDAELVLEEIRRGGYEPTWERVDTATALTDALTRESWGVIICDWVMPQFSAPAALALLREHRADVPIIIVSGQVGEECAVTAMKAGAQDFVSKNKLARLCPGIERKLQEVQVRRARRDAEEVLRRTEWLVTKSQPAELFDRSLCEPPCGSVVALNTCRRLADTVGEPLLGPPGCTLGDGSGPAPGEVYYWPWWVG